MVTTDYIVKGLMQRGLPEHVARGFAMNMQSESGLNPGINEVSPIVPGSRGGYGLYQLTGPRRRAYEAYAANRGVDLADPDVQLDFLMQELQGPESRAAQSIMASNDAPGAAVAIARDFLRPAKEHLDRRIAQYTGQKGVTMQPTVSTQGAMPAQEEKQPFYKNSDFWDRTAIAFSGLSMFPNQALMQMSADRIKDRSTQKRTAQQKNATADWLASQGMGDLAEGVRSGAIPAAAALQMAMKGPDDARTALQKNYEYAIAQGMTPDQARAWVSNAPVVNVGGQQSKKYGDAPEGTVWALDDQGNHVMEEGPGGTMRPKVVPLGGTAAEKRSIEVGGAAGKNADAAARAQDSINLIESVMNDPALPQITGMFQGRIPPITQAGTDLAVKVEQLQGQAFLQAFESLKGGGQITEREGQAAQNAMARLQRAQSTEAFVASLKELSAIMERGKRRAMGENVPEYNAGGGGFSVTGRID